jgi:Winged helix DNA-binding domain
VVERVSRGEVIAFRLAAHNLSERLGPGELLAAAGRCGIQNSPPGSALPALHARVQSLTSAQFTRAIADDKSLIQTWCMRGAPFYVPTADAPVFTTGVLPPTETAMRHFIRGVSRAVDQLGITVTDAVELTGAEIGDALAGRRLAINELGEQIATRIAVKLPTRRRTIWEQEGPYAPGQTLGEGVVHFCIRILTLRGVVCFAPRAANRSPFVLVDEWLGHPLPDIDPDVSRAELVRRYLHGHGPATRAGFAAWIGMSVGDTRTWWNLIQDELTPVDFGGRSWMLTEDVATLRSASMPTGVRLLPPGDPYIQTRDRDTIVEKPRQRDVWKVVGAPGTILAAGEIAGTWRSRRKGHALTVTVSVFGSLSDRHRSVLRDEADQIGALRDASDVEIEFDGG